MSGNVPNALSLLMSGVDGALRAFSVWLHAGSGWQHGGGWRSRLALACANPSADGRLDDLPPDRPLLIVRAGCDAMAGLNRSIDRFTARALALNKAFTL